jgi:Uma2 family endonuclease
MPTMPNPTVTTADQLLTLREAGFRHELVQGQMRRMSPAGWRHGAGGSYLHEFLTRAVREQGLGMTFLAETGFLLARNPDTVLAPDISFVRTDRLPTAAAEGFFPGPPDLAVEVISPGDGRTEIAQKVRRWLDHGTRLVWVVDPVARTLAVHEPSGIVRLLGTEDTLTGGDVVRGFTVCVREIFPSDS